MSTTPDEPPRLARGMWMRFLAATCTIVLLTAAGSATAVLLEVDTAVDAFNRFSTPLDVDGVLDDVDAGAPQTILVLGSDRRYDDRKSGRESRSDTMILVRLDPSQGATAVLSIPRDLKMTYTRRDGTRYSDKINAAYEIGGPRATVRKVKELMGGAFPIHHVVNINFGAFTRAVNRLGCFYVDVDRRYFNDNRPPVQSATQYATIDLKPGYQRLCGQDSLDFVRFRHLDTDIVRGARQQHYLSAAKDQVGVERLFRDREKLLELFGQYTDTDINSSAAILRLLKLTYESSRDPLRRVKLDVRLGTEFVTISESKIAKARDEFLNAQASAGATGSTRPRARRPGGDRRNRDALAPGLDAAPQQGEDQAVIAAVKLPFPVYYPKAIRRGARYWDGRANSSPRTYDIFDESRRRRRAYRMVIEAPGIGEYYGIQGTNWMDPPIIASPSEIRDVDGRRLMLYRDGTRLRMVAWKTDKAVYWVSNTLLRSLTNRQMLGIARSLTRVGSSG